MLSTPIRRTSIACRTGSGRSGVNAIAPVRSAPGGTVTITAPARITPALVPMSTPLACRRMDLAVTRVRTATPWASHLTTRSNPSGSRASSPVRPYSRPASTSHAESSSGSAPHQVPLLSWQTLLVTGICVQVDAIVHGPLMPPFACRSSAIARAIDPV